MSLPLVGITACQQPGKHLPEHRVGEKYVNCVVSAVRAVPMIIPALESRIEPEAITAHLDGLLVTGSPSNVEPHHYEGNPSRAGTLHDPARDATTLPLIRAAVAAGLPLFCICRGIQELNVALGGTLHQLVHEVPGRLDHRSNKALPIGERYGPTHPVAIVPGGALARLLGRESVMVNSLHAQGIDRIAPGLRVEATAEDGQIEAVSLPSAKGFLLALQWHPEWPDPNGAISRPLFTAFGDAVRAWARDKARVREPA
jgi:putative glutamine amidotransferase